MSTLTTSSAPPLQAYLEPLVRRCPCQTDYPKDCPLVGITKLDERMRGKFLSALTEAEMSFMAAYCHACRTTRLDLVTANSDKANGHIPNKSV